MLEMGKIEKMYIEAYPDNTFSPDRRLTIQGTSRFTLLMNPETISRKYGIEYVDDQRNGTANPGKYWRSKPEEFKLDILFDSTGVIRDAGILPDRVVNPFDDSNKDVTAQIQLLKDFCYHFDGEIHRPHYIKICWGTEDFLFKGAITALDTDYKLFRPDGKPIRAVVHLSIISALDESQARRLEDARSPDITHQRIFKAGDRYALLVNKIYNDPNYYIDVAKANKMPGFRKIAQGTKINFPPVK